MDSYKSFDDFTNLYSLSKTLRFELKPVGKTLENIEKKGMLSNDEKRAEDYKVVKKLIDLYHKNFIEKVLSKFLLSTEDKGKKDSLQEYYKIYINKNRDAKQKEDLKKISESLRKQISVAFKKDEDFARINKKELIREDLPKFLKDLKKSSILSEFNDFTSYFTGFHENRQNMYSDEEKSTAISYRLINENLPKFIDNLKIYIEIKDVLTAEIQKITNELKKELNNIKLDNLFCIEGFNKTLTQKQIDLYNTIIGGKTENNVKIQGLNEYINLYNQQNKNQRLPKLKQLYKQILSDHNSLSWLPEAFEDDNSVLEGIENYYSDLKDKLISKECTLKELLLSINKYNLDKIYIKNDLQLTEISQKLLQSWNTIPEAVKELYRKDNPRKPKENAEKFEERCEKYFKSFDSFSIEFLNKCLTESNIKASVEDYFINLGKEKDVEKSSDLFCKIEDNYSRVKDLLNTKYSDNRKLSQDDESIEKIKELLDSIKNLQFFIKPLLGKGNEAEKDEQFYGEFTAFYENLDKITPLYNKVRNYMTKKPYSTEKMKLNFENSTLLNGWDLNKEKDNLGIILIKDGLYYLGIIDKKSNKIFDGKLDNNGKCYKKMEYKLLPGPNKMLPKVFFSKSRIDEFNPSSEIKNNYDKETHKKGPNFSLKDCHALIDFFKSSIQKHEDWSKFNFNFSDTQSYEDLSGFYREVEHQGYKITFKDISENYINELVDSGKLYLFQIYNKDFSPYSKGTPNLHTLYWKMLFDNNNLANVVYKLNGEAELFYRKSSIHYDKPTHPANQPINNKNTGNPKKQSLFAYDLIKDKRYTLDKFQFHVPITINFKATGGEFINDKVNECIRNNGIEHIIGIDRGERNLLYLSVIDLKGNIVEQYSLNEIINNVTKNGKSYSFKTDYHSLLDKREEERLKARQSWKTIEGIKDLKEGYLSQVIHKISELMIKYNAIVVMEDLNFGFMRGRQKVEKQVYQKFEQMLIDKLNYLVDKKANPLSNGGCLRLTS